MLVLCIVNIIIYKCLAYVIRDSALNIYLIFRSPELTEDRPFICISAYFVYGTVHTETTTTDAQHIRIATRKC